MDKTGPFQNFDDQSDKSQCAPRLSALRAEMAKQNLDGFVVPRSDEHMNEYVPPRAERLAWLTAFTGSAGAAMVFKDSAAIFVDGRYTLQVRQQTDTSLFEPRDLVGEGVAGYLEAHAPKGARIGYDPWLHTAASVETMVRAVSRSGAALVPVAKNPIDAIWPDQPGAPLAKAIAHDLALSGEGSEAKRVRIGESVKKRGADVAVLTLPDSICWLLNLRGGDLPHTPFALAFATLSNDGAVELFMDERKTTPDLIQHLGNNVRLRKPDEFAGALSSLKGKTVLVDPSTAAAAIFSALDKADAKILRGADPCQLPKACKNQVEVENMRRAHIRDAGALAKFFAWFASEAPKGELTEIEAAQALEAFRAATGALSDLSFDSIAGAGPDGAIVHYRVTRSTNRPIKKGEIFLIDSGAQYPDGTTDVTRAVIVGVPTEEMRDRFTRVLKGHIALATARFPEGTTGQQLDAFARRPLWEAGLDYEHGTGHGVGSYLSVHEGPQNISKRPIPQPLLPGMICSNEPGYYKTGEYGIRIENLIVVRKADVPGAEKKVFEFETITLAPIDLALVNRDLLSEAERDWLNAYHVRVRETVSPLVDADTRKWLGTATQAI